MINHFRTLLLNMAPTQTPAYGEEYIDPSFIPRTLMGKIKEVQNVLVPAGASRADKNFYGYALMQLAYAPDFEKYIYAFDSRVVRDAAYAPYLSADVPRGTYPAFSVALLYPSLSAAMMSPGPGLFTMNPQYQADMDVFKTVWFGNAPHKDKVTAAIFAAVYAIQGMPA